MNAPLGLFEPLKPWPFPTLPPAYFDLIVADPPWKFKNYGLVDGGGNKGAAAHYDCLPPEVIRDTFPIGDLAAKNSMLLCWATIPLLPRQIAVVQAWGFEYKSAMVWRKVSKNGKQMWGTGYRVRAMVEVVIIATKGEPKQHKPFPGLFDGLLRRHSEKPESFYELVDKCVPNLTRRADVFVRRTRPGYLPFGDEATKFDEVQP